MHRRGHVGLTLLAYAPIGYVLLNANQPAMALLGLLGVVLVEPLPDNDLWIPWLSHRGTSHSVFCALLVGAVLGSVGWLVGEPLADIFASVLASGDFTTVGIFAGVLDWLAVRIRDLDGVLLAQFGFVAGVSGIIVHLIGDVITIAGIRPLLPFSRRRISLIGVRADSTTANNGLFGLGVLAIALVLLATAPSIGGVAAAQETTEGPELELNNQTTNGSTVVVDSVPLPDGGFIVIHGRSYLEGVGGPAAIAVSKPLDAGTHRNVTVDLTNSVPGSSETSQRMQQSDIVAAVAYRDTNGNGTLDYYRPESTADTPYGNGTRAVGDSAFITVAGSRAAVADEQASASIKITDQTSDGDSVTVDSATLPSGGFLSIHDQRYLSPSNKSFNSTIGVTSYLKPGKHRNVTVPVLSGALHRNQTVVAVSHYDTNGNRTFDFVIERGGEDVGYVHDGKLVAAQAKVTVPSRVSATPAKPVSPLTESPTIGEATDISIGDSSESATPSRTTLPAKETSQVSTAQDETNGRPWFSLLSDLLLSPTNALIVVLIIAIGAVFAIRS